MLFDKGLKWCLFIINKLLLLIRIFGLKAIINEFTEFDNIIKILIF